MIRFYEWASRCLAAAGVAALLLAAPAASARADDGTIDDEDGIRIGCGYDPFAGRCVRLLCPPFTSCNTFPILVNGVPKCCY